MERDELEERAWKLFERLEPGQYLVISQFAKRDPAMFIEFAKGYIDAGGFIEFTSDYRKIRGIPRLNWLQLHMDRENCKK